MPKALADQRLVDPVLTTLAQGFKQSQLVGKLLLPAVPVSKEEGKVPIFGKEAFKLYNTIRALRGKSNRMTPEGLSTTPYELEEHDIEYPVDYREAAEAIMDRQMQATYAAEAIIDLGQEKEIADLVLNTSNYPGGNKVTLTGNDQWSADDSDPIGDIEAGKEAVRAKIGQRPNTAVMGPTVFKRLKAHPALKELIKYSMKGIITLDLMKEIFGFDNLAVGEAIYSTDAGVFVDIWGDYFAMAYVAPTPAVPDGQQAQIVTRSEYEPSFGYTFQKRGMPQVDTRMEDGKLQLVRCTNIYQAKIVGSSAGYLISDCIK